MLGSFVTQQMLRSEGHAPTPLEKDKSELSSKKPRQSEITNQTNLVSQLFNLVWKIKHGLPGAPKHITSSAPRSHCEVVAS